jgi:hypothetical protein
LLGSSKASADSFLNDGPLEFGEDTHHLEHRLATGVVVSIPLRQIRRYPDELRDRIYQPRRGNDGQ